MRGCLQLRRNLTRRPWRHVAGCISLHEFTLGGGWCWSTCWWSCWYESDAFRGARGRGDWDKGCEEWEEWRNSERCKKGNVPLEPPSPTTPHLFTCSFSCACTDTPTLPSTCAHSLFEIDYIKHFEGICWHMDRLHYVSMVTNICQWNGVIHPPPTICKMKVGVRH